jgi:hypothetical protein
MRAKRAMLQPDLAMLQPNCYLAAHIKVYPQYEEFLRIGTYDPKDDPYINPLLRPPESLPNCPDGRYHEPNPT